MLWGVAADGSSLMERIKFVVAAWVLVNISSKRLLC